MKPSQPKIQFDNAYQQINFYDYPNNKKKKPILSTHTGPDNLSQIFQNSDNIRTIQNDVEEIYLNAQPFYVGEVDHNIEEIGLMAVREVRYVDDDQWETMLKEQKKYMDAMKNQTMQGLRETRKIHASRRDRNQRGQFVPKQAEVQAKKKGRKIEKQKKKDLKKQRKQRLLGKCERISEQQENQE